MSSKLANRLLSASIVVAAAALLLLALLFADTDATAQAQTLDTPTAGPGPEQPGDFGEQRLPPIEGKLNPPKYPNMDSSLNRIVEQVQTGQFSAQAAAESAPIHREESVAVTLYVTEGYAQSVWDYLEQSGASPRNIGIDYIEAYVPVSLLPDASTQEGVISIRTIIPPQPAQGTVVSEGAAVHGVPAWHAAGYKGQGVKIGIIDTGFENFQNLLGTELPSTVEARCYTDIRMVTSDLEDCTYSEDHESRRLHGTAVTEAVFDIAPEATYYISNPSSQDDLKSAVEWMVEDEVDVINMSLGFTWEGPGDGTTPYSVSPLNTVNIAVTGGITWANAAGNNALDTWYGSFTDTDSNRYQNFDPNDECNGIAIEAGTRVIAQLRWEGTWGGATRDLDLYLYDVSDFTAPIISSEYGQSGGALHIPYEWLEYTASADGVYCLAVKHFGGAAPSWIQLQAWGVPRLEHYTESGSITNPAESANPGLLAVGAAHWSDTSIIEPFSSQGPTPGGGIKPDIVGADGGRSVSYISEERPDGSWGGTSQASPHVAGLAALVKQRSPAYTAEEVADYLKRNANPRGAVPNNTWGYGFAMLSSDPCVKSLEGDSTVRESWSENCPSESRSGNYASYYTFSLDESAQVTITLESSVEDPYLYLREGTGRNGSVLCENDDYETLVSGQCDLIESSLDSNTDSGISASLAAGSYTIEVTTYEPGEVTTYEPGEDEDFTLVLQIGGSTTPAPTPPPEPAAGFVNVSRGYDHACALHSDGSITCWGDNDMGQATPPSSGRFTTISSDYKGSCAVRDDGAVFCWGSFTVNP